ncbi:hypothetical protein CEXT_152851, partial [Caerostris extrusa]
HKKILIQCPLPQFESSTTLGSAIDLQLSNSPKYISWWQTKEEFRSTDSPYLSMADIEDFNTASLATIQSATLGLAIDLQLSNPPKLATDISRELSEEIEIHYSLLKFNRKTLHSTDLIGLTRIELNGFELPE